MSVKVQLEQEKRFRIFKKDSAEILDALLTMGEISGFQRTARIVSETFNTYYFDTLNDDLLKTGKTLRLREMNIMGCKDWYLTLKSQGETINIERRFTEPLSPNFCVVPLSLVASPFEFFEETRGFKNFDYVQKFLRVKRTVLSYETSDCHKIELSLDECVGGKQDINFDVLEIENENASQEKFNSFVEMVKKSLPVLPTNLSKYQTLCLLNNGKNIYEEFSASNDNDLQYISEILEALKRIIKPPIIILIGGGSSSGKEYICKKLGMKLLHSDDYYQTGDFMRLNNISNWDDPRAVDLELFARHLGELKQRKTINKPVYCKKKGRIGWESFEPDEIIGAEGLFCLMDPIYEKGDFHIFVEADFASRLTRRATRDSKELGGRTEHRLFQVLTYFLNVVEPAHRRFIEPLKNRADIIIKNNCDFEKEFGSALL